MVALSYPYLFRKRGVYYFSRRVPKDLMDHYDRTKIVFSLRTKSTKAAKVKAASLASQLEEDWLTIRWRIAEEVLMAMMYQEIPVLPIHDSFIVRTGYAFLLNEEMNKAFEKIVRANVGITTDTTRANEHFGVPEEEFKEVAGKSRVVKFGSDEMWEAFKKHIEQPMIMDRYLSSWKQRDV